MWPCVFQYLSSGCLVTRHQNTLFPPMHFVRCCVQPCYLLFLCSCSSLRVGLFWFVLLSIKTFTLQWVIYELFSILNSGRLKKYTSLRLDSLIPGHLGIINVSLIHAMRISLHIKEKLWVRLTYCYKSP